MKKTLSLILALLMTASCASAIFADEAEEVAEAAAIAEEAVVEEEVAEVPEETPYDLAIEFLQAKNIMHGKEDGLPHAEDGVKRYEMALFTGRVATGWVEDDQWEDGTANNSQFNDLAGSGAEKVLGALSYVNQKGIIEGYPDGTFKPEQGVTYREALTMAVRTLGYTGLEYPWGYIEKAVGLGLTDGITGVAYTDAANRGVVAQIVYNMLFAETSKGDTLAMRSFGVEYGWQNIMIVVDAKATVNAAKLDGDKNPLVGTNKDNGIVGFQIVENDGTLADTVYYVKGDYKVGKIYNALFEIDADEELVNMIGACPYKAEVVKNEGLTDDEAVAYEVADKICEYLKDYTLVDKYHVKNLSKTTFYNDELIVKDGSVGVTVIEVKADAETPYAIDWTNGDILVKVKDEDGNYVDGEYAVAWHYLAKLDQYYRIKDTAVIDGKYADVIKEIGYPIGIELMDENDVKEIKDAIAKALEEEKTYQGFATILSMPAQDAYATLEVYDLTDDGKADYGTYEAYQLAYFSEHGEDMCGECDATKAYDFDGIKYLVEGSCDHAKVTKSVYLNSYTMVEGYEPNVDADGNYVAGWVIYGVNEATNEIKVVKTIEKLGENDDADSYVATGVVRGYSMSKNTVTIGDEVLPLNYETLKGADFVKINENADSKAAYTATFDKLFNQFVEYVVVDGKVVKINTLNASDTNYIVVEEYYGIDSENYIVVLGYATDTLKLQTFRIGSVDSWERGDFFFYADDIEDQFTKGSVLKIRSADVDAENGVIYYVDNLGYFAPWTDKNGKWWYENDDLVDVDSRWVEISITEGYRDVTVYKDGFDPFNEDVTPAIKTANVDTEKTGSKRISSDDKYIIIDGNITGNNGSLWNYMPIYVYEGKAPDGWAVGGQMVVGDKDSKTFIIVNPTYVYGFDEDYNAETGFVVVLNKRITERNYNGYGQDYYIYGATTYELQVFNLLTANVEEVVVTTNIPVEEGQIYRTISNRIVSAAGLSFENFMEWVDIPYGADLDNEADYLFLNGTFKADYVKNDGVGQKNFSKEVLAPEYGLTRKDVTDLTDNGYTVQLVTLDSKGLVASITALDEAKYADYVADNKIKSVQYFAIYDVDAEKTVVYVLNYTGKIVVEDVNKNASATVDNYIVVDTDAKVEATVSATITKENGEVKKAAINSITFAYTGDATKETHASIVNDGLYFGYDDDCKLTDWNVKINDVSAFDVAEGTNYTHEDADCDANCALIKAVEVALGEINVTKDYQVLKVQFTGTRSNTVKITYTFTLGYKLTEAGIEVWFATVAPNQSTVSVNNGEAAPLPVENYPVA